MVSIYELTLIVMSLLAFVSDAVSRQNFEHLIKLYSMSSKDLIRTVQASKHLFENKTLVVCVVVREPFVIYSEPRSVINKTRVDIEREQADLDNYSGIAIEIVKRMSEIYNFKIKIIRPRDNEFGVLVPGKGWTGLTGSLSRNESDIGVTALSITSSRSQVIDFTRAYYFETAAILLSVPEEVRNYYAIFEPFSSEVWFLLLASILLLIFLITVMTKLEETQSKRHKVGKLVDFLTRPSSLVRASKDSSASQSSDERLRRYSRALENRIASIDRVQLSQRFGITWVDRFYYAVTCVINILLIRDIKNPPTQTPIRILVCVWWLATIVIVNIYLGVLFGQLVVPRQPKSIETLEELIGQRQVKWCVTKGSSIYEIFRDSPPSSVFGQLGRRMETVSSADEGVGKVVRSGWTFIRERSILVFKMAQEHNRMRACKTQLAREEFLSVGFGIGLAKDSPYLEPFDSALSLMIENGFVSRWKALYWPVANQYTDCRLKPLREGEPLSIKHFTSIYLVCSCIVMAAAVILIYQSIHAHLFRARILPLLYRLKRWVWHRQ